jgi:tetratricopeptide (TPR) repeat protein
MAKEFVNQLQPGMKVGKYQVVSLVATGGMSMLYKAYDKTLDRYVAIKQIAPNLAADEKFVERFRREAQTLARVSQGQQNVVGVYELIEESGGLFMIMEFVEGTSLQTLMDRGAASLQTGLGILLKVALGLKAIHDQGLVHRDLKPDNIMVQPAGNVKIADFGLVGRAGGRTSLPMGTTQYMAPEMFAGGTVDGRADIYSLGFIAYQVFAGPEKFREVFSDVLADPQSANIRWMHWHSNPAVSAPSLRDVQPGVPPLVARIVERMMDKDASRRFNSADQIIKWLRQIFVMYVQGQSLSEQDSAKLEEQVDADIQGGTVPARGRAAAAGAGGTTMPMPAGGETGSTEPALKTAPLAKRPRHWQDYAKWGGIAAGVIIAALVGLKIYGDMQVGERKTAAKAWMREAKALFDEGRFAKAAKQYEEVEREFQEKELRDITERAHYGYLKSEINQAIKDQKWDEADRVRRALMKTVDDWSDASRKRKAEEGIGRYEAVITQRKHLADMKAAARLAEQSGEFLEAVKILREIEDVGISDDLMWIERECNRLMLREAERQAETKIADTDQFLSRSGQPDEKQLSQARAMYQEAQKVFDSKKVQSRIRNVAVALEIVRLWESIQEDMSAEKWGAAAAKSDKVFELLSQIDDEDMHVISQADLEQRAKEAKANAVLAQAKALKAGGDPKGAIKLLKEVIRIDPSNKDAYALLHGLEGAADAARLLGEARRLEKAGDVEGAKGVLEQVIAMETDAGMKDGLRKRIETMMQKHWRREYHNHKNKKQWSDAKTALDSFESYGGRKGDVEWMDRQLSNEMNYHMLFDKGKQSLDAGLFDDAKKVFIEATRIPLGRQWLRNARDMANECDYRKYIKAGRDAQAGGKVGEARGYYRIAQSRKDTEEVRKLLKDLEGS